MGGSRCLNGSEASQVSVRLMSARLTPMFVLSHFTRPRINYAVRTVPSLHSPQPQRARRVR